MITVTIQIRNSDKPGIVFEKETILKDGEFECPPEIVNFVTDKITKDGCGVLITKADDVIGAIKAIRNHTRMGLKEAKNIVDLVRSGRSAIVKCPNPGSLLRDLFEIGVEGVSIDEDELKTFEVIDS